MRVDKNRTDEWYLAISEFLESRSGEEDALCPGSLVTALCHVLADAAEAVRAPDDKRLEAVVRLTAQAMGYDDVLLLLGKDVGPAKRN